MVRAVIFFFLLSGFLYAQVPRTGGGVPNRDQDPFAEDLPEDTTEQEDPDEELNYRITSALKTNALSLKYNDPNWHFPDTSLNNRHRFDAPAERNYYYQNLGNLGTPLNPIYYQAPEIIGARSGFDQFDFYFAPEPVEFYNSKAPFTRLSIVLGGNGRSNVDVDFSRNINPFWNVTANYRNITSDKQIGATRSRGDRQVSSTYYDYGSLYRSKDNKYLALAYFKRINHQVNEVGGLVFDSAGIDFGDVDRAEVRFNGVSSREYRSNIHFYHEFRPGGLIQFYHEGDYTRLERHFNIESNTVNSFYLSDPLIIADSSVDQNHFTEWDQEIGIKGDLDRLFYLVYGKFRRYQMQYKYLPDQVGNEVYLGGKLRFDISEKYNLEAGADYLFFDRYNLYGRLETPFAQVRLRSMIYSPAYNARMWFGNFGKWENNFQAITHNELEGNLRVKFLDQEFRPFLRLTNIFQPIYFDQERRPQQASGAAQFIIPGLDYNFEFGPIGGRLNAHYNLLSGGASEAFRVPDYQGLMQIFYQGIWFNRSLEIQLGLEGWYRPAYFGDAYNPWLQNFYLQDDSLTDGYFNVDFFMNFKIQNAICFFKITNLSQLPAQGGYYITPGYPGQATAFDFGVDWYLLN